LAFVFDNFGTFVLMNEYRFKLPSDEGFVVFVEITKIKANLWLGRFQVWGLPTVGSCENI
jgi:hypothetical protein